MIGTYFFFILTVFILIVTAAVLNFTRDLKTSLKSPLEEALKKFEDQPTDDEGMFVYKKAWNEVQTEVSSNEFFRLFGLCDLADIIKFVQLTPKTSPTFSGLEIYF